jgi:hypothetical protein
LAPGDELHGFGEDPTEICHCPRCSCEYLYTPPFPKDPPLLCQEVHLRTRLVKGPSRRNRR